MRNIYSLLLIALVLACSSQANAQQAASRRDTSAAGKYRVAIMAKAFGDSIVVRWAPNQSALFRQALKTGYLLTRRSIVAGKSQIDWQITVKPWTQEEWLQNVAAKDTAAAASAQLVIGTNTPIGAKEDITLDKILDQQNQNDLRMMLALVLADASPRNARGMALGWVDKKVVKGTNYSYTIYPLTDQKFYPIAPVSFAVVNENSTVAPRMLPVKTVGAEHSIKLQWDRMLGDRNFSSYYVERSADGGKTFRRLTKRPWLQPPASAMEATIQFTDSVPQNYKSYKYRVFGITPFGELAPSEVATGFAMDKTPPAAVEKLVAKHVQGSLVKLNWNYPAQTSDLGGFVIAKGVSIDGPFTPLTNKPLASGAREFLDTTAFPHLPNFYRVVAVDTARNVSAAQPVFCLIKDSKGPSKPKGLEGYIDSTGFVRIVWGVNPEADILGYRVLTANATHHAFTGKTTGYLAIPGFNDTVSLNTLTRKKYYRVVAYDKSYNPSEPSDILELTKPDRIAPVTPVIRTYTVADSAVVIQWEPSMSGDVKQQILLRRGKSTERWIEIAQLSPAEKAYADANVKSNSEYGYALVAVDSAGLRSDISFPLNVKMPKRTPAAVSGLKAVFNADKTVSLNWAYTIPNCRFVIYKAAGSQLPGSYDAVYDTRQYRDKKPEKGVNQYMVKVIYQDGMESALSKPVEVEVP